MAVFYDTGGGDIFAGASKKDVVEAMKKDIGDDFEVELIEKVSGNIPLVVTSTIAKEYDASKGAYCIASSNT